MQNPSQDSHQPNQIQPNSIQSIQHESIKRPSIFSMTSINSSTACVYPPTPVPDYTSPSQTGTIPAVVGAILPRKVHSAPSCSVSSRGTAQHRQAHVSISIHSLIPFHPIPGAASNIPSTVPYDPPQRQEYPEHSRQNQAPSTPSQHVHRR